MNLSYELTGRGWARAVIVSGESSFAIEWISYLSDALRSLIESTVRLLEGSNRIWFAWYDEPGEHRWIIERAGEQLSIRILWFEDAFKALPDEKGKEVFSFACSLDNFTAEVLRCGQSLLKQYGESEYQAQWGMEFPAEQCGRLEWLITGKQRQPTQNMNR